MFLASFIVSMTSFSLVNSQITYNCNFSAPCGCSSRPAVISKIFGGETAVNQTWDWAVSILFNQTYYCGGVLISPSWVLTGIGCIGEYRTWEIIVSAGSIFLGQQQVRQASFVVNHPNYDPVWWTNDIALIRVSIPFNMSDPSIGLVCLPAATDADFPPVNASLVAVGWGESTDNDYITLILQQVTLQRLSSTARICATNINDSTTQLCALGMNGAKGVCGGDMGGPLMMFTSSQQWMLIGINSYYFGCSNTGYPSVHTRVIRYLSWIRSMNVTDAVTVGSNDIPVLTTATTTNSRSTSVGTTTVSNQNPSSTQRSVASSFHPTLILSTCAMIVIIIQRNGFGRFLDE